MSRAPVNGAEALSRWVDLVAQAERCVGNPGLSTEKLERACDMAFRAPVPAGELTRGNPFIMLLDTARGFARSTMAERSQMTGVLERALDAAATLRPLNTVPGGVNAVAPPGPTPRFRADLDG